MIDHPNIRAAMSAVFVAGALSCVSPVFSAQTVYLKDAAISASVSGMQTLSLTKSIDWGYFGVDVAYVKANDFRFSYKGIAEAYMMFETKPGTLVDMAMVLNTPLMLDNSGKVPSSIQTFALNETKYYAYWDDRGGVSGAGPLNRVSSEDLFGWMALTRVGSALVVTASATAKAAPIEVGKFTAAVPEPASWALFGLGVLGLMAVRKQGKRHGLTMGH